MQHALRCASCGGINRVQPDRVGAKCGRCQATLKPGPQDLSDDQLDQLVKQSPVPVLVDFWAPWCGPCKSVAPHIEQLAQRHAGALIVAKVNTDQHQRTMANLGIRGIPTLAVWKGGKLAAQQAGAMMGPQLEQWVQQAIQ